MNTSITIVISIMICLISLDNINTQTDRVDIVAWNSDDTKLAIVSNTTATQINILNIQEQTIKQEIVLNNHLIKMITWHPIRPDIFAFSVVDLAIEQEYIWIYDLSTNEIRNIIQSQSSFNPTHSFESITDLKWNSDGSLLAFTTYSRQYGNSTNLTLWNFDTSSEMQYYADQLPSIGERGNIFGSVSWSSDGSQFAIVTNHDIQIWDLASLNRVKVVALDSVSSYSVDWSPNGRYIVALATIGADISNLGIYIWDLEIDQIFAQPIFADQVMWRNNEQIIIQSATQILFMDAVTKEISSQLVNELAGNFRTFAWSHSGDRFAVSSLDGELKILTLSLTDEGEHQTLIPDTTVTCD